LEAAETNSAEESEALPYNWSKQWYPVSPLSALDPSRATSTELLGRRLVVWRDAAEKWRCFQDLCPHRLAPLSGDQRRSTALKA
jgi:phenylpropionate dioxygenase-like ring-hydroxylating dioxygenase large terminal subunit